MLIYYLINSALLPSWEQKNPFFARGLKLCKTINMKKTRLHQVDALDLQILEQLQKNGRLANSQLATSVGLSAPSCLERIKKLEKNWLN